MGRESNVNVKTKTASGSGSKLTNVMYPGNVSRQRLVDFCQKKLPEIEKRQNELMDAIYFAEKAKNIHTEHALYEAMQETYGYVKALREVCEWAKENLIEEDPIPLDDFDVDVAKDKLRERLAGERR